MLVGEDMLVKVGDCLQSYKHFTAIQFYGWILKILNRRRKNTCAARSETGVGQGREHFHHKIK